MDFRDDAELDSSQVESRGGGGVSGGGLAIGGGAAGVIVLVLALVFGVDLDDVVGDDPVPAKPGSDLSAKCRTGRDADRNEECRVVGVVNSIQRYWPTAMKGYKPAKTVTFSGKVRTACGAADTSDGPFYCPADHKVYLDLSFFKELQRDYGAKGGPFAQAYVIGHEYGHHVQNLLGTVEKAEKGPQKGPKSASVRLELQADCYSGAWAKNAYETGLFEKPFTDKDIKEALSAASAVGDDNIQRRSQGRVTPEGFTHGTSAQRVTWFTTGYKSGDPGKCDTFAGKI
ncbi:neutral zinc metallopeptidase [Streptosporangium sp. NPDC087985]|uniref:KPN_02809 family neutral zinc metallopeptidase n=1 Tax=Streptosporangium sp. NPDC087985 TaxID=3366196 RepID=UPI00381CF930